MKGIETISCTFDRTTDTGILATFVKFEIFYWSRRLAIVIKLSRVSNVSSKFFTDCTDLTTLRVDSNTTPYRRASFLRQVFFMTHKFTLPSVRVYAQQSQFLTSLSLLSLICSSAHDCTEFYRMY